MKSAIAGSLNDVGSIADTPVGDDPIRLAGGKILWPKIENVLEDLLQQSHRS